MNPLYATDGYKLGHHLMYPKGTITVFSNLTPRSNKYAPHLDRVVVMLQPALIEIDDMFKKFFALPENEAIDQVAQDFSAYLGSEYNVEHFRKLHRLQFLPLSIRTIPDGLSVPIGVPILTIKNTLPDFYWLPNFLETIISALAWKACTSASTALLFRKNLENAIIETDIESLFLSDYLAHDFSMRGMDSVYAIMVSSLGHAMFNKGSDSLPAIPAVRKFYFHQEVPIVSVNATEHSVMSAGIGLYGELRTFRELINTFPKGILSVVSDTMDLWKVITEYLPALKKEILAREGKLVIRPDSGDPVDIICGVAVAKGKTYKQAMAMNKGVIELLWDIFGGYVNSQGYKVLDPHIGAIYGDSITLDRQRQIYERLAAKGFAASNIVLGVGSYTYQYNSRDTLGFAVKATYCEVLVGEYPGEPGEDPMQYEIVGINIFKDPVTDDGTKKSAKGLLRVIKKDGDFVLEQECTKSQIESVENCLVEVYNEGFRIVYNWNDVKKNAAQSLILGQKKTV